MILETPQNWFYTFWIPIPFYIDFTSFSHFKQKLHKDRHLGQPRPARPTRRPRGPGRHLTSGRPRHGAWPAARAGQRAGHGQRPSHSETRGNGARPSSGRRQAGPARRARPSRPAQAWPTPNQSGDFRKMSLRFLKTNPQDTSTIYSCHVFCDKNPVQKFGLDSYPPSISRAEHRHRGTERRRCCS